MLDHVEFYVHELSASETFFTAALAPLGYTILARLPPGTGGPGEVIGYGTAGRPHFWITPVNPQHPASGPFHLAFTADSKEAVNSFYQAALAAGGKDNGPPGPRPYYSPNYYGAFVLDPDGNNMEAVHFTTG